MPDSAPRRITWSRAPDTGSVSAYLAAESHPERRRLLMGSWSRSGRCDVGTQAPARSCDLSSGPGARAVRSPGELAGYCRPSVSCRGKRE